MKIKWLKRGSTWSLKIGIYYLEIMTFIVGYKYHGVIRTLLYHGKVNKHQDGRNHTYHDHWSTDGNSLKQVKNKLLQKVKEFIAEDIE